MTMAPEITRGEFDMLRQAVAENSARITAIDQTGTRGVGIVQVQLTDLAKDVSALGQRLDTHDREHEQDKAVQRSTRRWIFGAFVAVLTLVEGPLLYLVSVHR